MISTRTFLLLLLPLLLSACAETRHSKMRTLENTAILKIQIVIKGKTYLPETDKKSLLRCVIQNNSDVTRTFFTEPKYANFQLFGQSQQQNAAMKLDFLDPYFTDAAQPVTLRPREEKVVFEAPLRKLLFKEKKETGHWKWINAERSDRAAAPFFQQNDGPQKIDFWFIADWGKDQLRSDPITLVLHPE